jgi:hypothetical protein
MFDFANPRQEMEDGPTVAVPSRAVTCSEEFPSRNIREKETAAVVSATLTQV